MKQRTLDDLLAVAIEQEIQSQELYKRAIGKTSDPATQAFLRTLIEEEERHQRLLESVREMQIYDGSVAVGEAEELELASASHGFPDQELEDAASVDAVLEVALAREHRARITFTRMAAVAKHPELQTLFKKLADEEDSHHQRIERKYRTDRGETIDEM